MKSRRNHGDPERLDPIVASLSDEDELVSLAAVQALVKALVNLDLHQREIISDYLLDVWKDKSGAVRGAILEALANLESMGSRQFRTLLLDALADPDEDVRIAALYLAGKRGDQELVAGIQDALDAREWRVREEAVYALGAFITPGPVRPTQLIKALYDHSPYVRRMAIRVLGDKIPVDSILTDLDAANEPETRERAARILGEVGAERELYRLIKAARHDEDSAVRGAALLAMSRLVERKRAEQLSLPRQVIESALIEAVHDSDPGVSETARMVLDALYPETAAMVEAGRGEVAAFLAVHRRIGRSNLLRLIGESHWAMVYLGEDIRDRSQVAVKLFFSLALEGREQQDFLHKVQTLARLRHPHIVRIRDYGIDESDGKIPFIATDYARRGSLDQFHPPGTVVPPATVLSYVKQIADALQYVHRLRTAHLNIKPSNILLIGDHDEIALTDFRISMRATPSDSPRPSQRGEHPASRRSDAWFYMAPELRSANPHGTAASDQYTLAVIVYEWLTGQHPFAIPRSSGELAKQPRLRPRSLHQRRPVLSRAIDTVIMRAMADEPQRRYPSIEAFAADLERAMQPPPKGNSGRRKSGPSSRGNIRGSGPLFGLLVLLLPALLLIVRFVCRFYI